MIPQRIVMTSSLVSALLAAAAGRSKNNFY
jgi:hypothetical protein